MRSSLCAEIALKTALVSGLIIKLSYYITEKLIRDGVLIKLDYKNTKMALTLIL
jgi:hypothetical protein